MTVRAWYQPRPERKLHGLVWMTDEQALDRLERGHNWVPVEGADRVAAAAWAEAAPQWGEPGYIHPEFVMEGEPGYKEESA